MPAPIKPPPSIDRLRELFSYASETGLFMRVVGRGKSPSGTVAGTKRKDGYISITVDRRAYPAHRLVWLFVYGQWPPQLDHINRNRSDNRISNLRPATPALNALNRQLQVNNHSGVPGVFRDGRLRLNPWHAYITVNSRTVALGWFETKEQAAAARNAAFQAEVNRRLIKVGEQYNNAVAA
jgi:HNH endonuclease